MIFRPTRDIHAIASPTKAHELSWRVCAQTPCRVLRKQGAAYLVRFLLSTDCKLNGESSFLVVELIEQGLDLMLCRDPHEFDEARLGRACSGGRTWDDDERGHTCGKEGPVVVFLTQVSAWTRSGEENQWAALQIRMRHNMRQCLAKRGSQQALSGSGAVR